MKPARRTIIGLCIVFAICAASVLTGGLFWMRRDWPFTRAALTSTLETRFARQVEIGRFRETWFPPGCVAENVRFLHRQRKDLPPLIAIRKLVVRASWWGLMRRQVSRMDISEVQLTVPPADSAGVSPVMPIVDAQSGLSGVDEIRVDNAEVQILSRTRNALPTQFRIRRLILENAGGSRIMPFRASVETVKPSGALEASGSLGPWNVKSALETPVSGTYRYGNADLSAFGGLSGKLSAEGGLNGTLGNVAVSGSLDVPAFHVDGSAHNPHLSGDFQASVDTTSADTVLKSVEARVGRSVLLASGTIAGTATAGGKTAALDMAVDSGKTAALDMAVDTGRVEDLLNFFSDEKKPSMTGAVKLRAHVDLPPGGGFLRKLRLNGDFGVAGASFTSPVRQAPVNRLSESASGETRERLEEDPRTVLSHLAGHVEIQGGVAKLHRVYFEFPGAAANMDGTYNLLARTVEIRGTLKTQGNLSDATSGFKAVLVKAVTPFLKKRHETIAPFVIRGAASNPSIGLDWTDVRP